MFRFDNPGLLLAFQEQIGAENTKRVKKISLWIRFPGPHGLNGLRDMLDGEYGSVASHWIAALDSSGLGQIKQLVVEAGMSGCEPGDVLSVLPMTDDLQDLIEEILGRGEDGEVPRLSLTGIREEERGKFLEEWETKMDQWS